MDDHTLDNNYYAIISLQRILLSQRTCLSSVSMTKLWSLKVPAWFLYKVAEFISLEQVKRRFPVLKNDKHFIPSLSICRTLYKMASICEKNDKKQILSLAMSQKKLKSCFLKVQKIPDSCECQYLDLTFLTIPVLRKYDKWCRFYLNGGTVGKQKVSVNYFGAFASQIYMYLPWLKNKCSIKKT